MNGRAPADSRTAARLQADELDARVTALLYLFDSRVNIMAEEGGIPAKAARTNCPLVLKADIPVWSYVKRPGGDCKGR